MSDSVRDDHVPNLDPPAGRNPDRPGNGGRPRKSPQALRELALSLGALALALLLGGLLLTLSGYDVREAYINLYDGAFGNLYSLADTLLNSIPLLFTGLAVAFAFRGGLFNIGAEGQLYVAALTSAVLALHLPHTWGAALIPLSLLGGALAGASWGFLPGYLKARMGAHEVITGIMLNYVAILLTTWLLKAYFKGPGPIDHTALIPPAARLPELIATTRLTWALFIALGLTLLVWWVLERTSFGMDLQAVGQNPGAAAYAGVPVPSRTILIMALSGAIAGLAGSTMVLGVLHRFVARFSPGYGYTGLAVAMLARSHPLAVIPAALLFGALQAGGMSMQLFARIPVDLMTVVQGLVILLVASPALILELLRRRRHPLPAPRRESR